MISDFTDGGCIHPSKAQDFMETSKQTGWSGGRATWGTGVGHLQPGVVKRHL